jgi:hypothetical protein
MAHVMNDDLRLADLVDDQISANRQTSKARIVRPLTDVGTVANAGRTLFDARNQAGRRRRIVVRYMGKYFFKVGQSSSLITNLYGCR